VAVVLVYVILVRIPGHVQQGDRVGFVGQPWLLEQVATVHLLKRLERVEHVQLLVGRQKVQILRECLVLSQMEVVRFVHNLLSLLFQKNVFVFVQEILVVFQVGLILWLEVGQQLVGQEIKLVDLVWIALYQICLPEYVLHEIVAIVPDTVVVDFELFECRDNVWLEECFGGEIAER